MYGLSRQQSDSSWRHILSPESMAMVKYKKKARILVSPIWAKFKIFLQKSFGKTWDFMDDILQKSGNINLNQLKNVLD